MPYANSPVSAGGDGAPVVHTVHHSMASTPRVLVSWGPGNTLRLSYLPQVVRDGDDDMKISSSREGDAANGQVVEVKLGKKDDQPLAEKRTLAYSSAQAFALLQNQKQQMLQSDGGSSRTGTFDWYILLSSFINPFRLLEVTGQSRGPQLNL